MGNPASQHRIFLLVIRTLLGAPGIATRNKDATRAPGIPTRNKNATRGSWHRYQEQGRH